MWSLACCVRVWSVETALNRWSTTSFPERVLIWEVPPPPALVRTWGAGRVLALLARRMSLDFTPDGSEIQTGGQASTVGGGGQGAASWLQCRNSTFVRLAGYWGVLGLFWLFGAGVPG